MKLPKSSFGPWLLALFVLSCIPVGFMIFGGEMRGLGFGLCLAFPPLMFVPLALIPVVTGYFLFKLFSNGDSSKVTQAELQDAIDETA